MRFFSVKIEWLRDYIGSCTKSENRLEEDEKIYLPHTLPSDTSSNATWLIPEIPQFLRDIPTPEPLKQRHHKFLSPLPLEAPQTLVSIESYQTFYFPPPNFSFEVNEQLKKSLQGRRLLHDELSSFTMEDIHQHVSNGWITYEPGIVRRGGRYFCQRCGNEDQVLFGSFDCFRCKQSCAYCRGCLMMGRVSGCTPLLIWNDETVKTYGDNDLVEKKHVMNWDGTLSFYQQKASDQLVKVITNFIEGKNQVNEFLVWAVCGAGKTEMLFHGIERGLNKHLQVLIATPRTDVVLELEPRFKSAFPNTVVTAFYGGMEDRFAGGDLIISTTHQLLRFYQKYDLVIIDEVDAFPYSMDKKLHYAVKNAKKEHSLTVYVTATPNERMKRAADNGQLHAVKVARRYHRFPLPVPRMQWIGNWRKRVGSREIPRALRFWILGHLQNEKQFFLFVPSVKLMYDVEKALIKVLGESMTIASVHSSDERRREKVMGFRNGEIRLLVTTTILERGVTVKGVQVAVLGAEDRIFTESALVQIAGRVGRSPDDPTGDVIFFHNGKTGEMLKAVKHIVEMNELGEKELDEEVLGREGKCGVD